MAMLYLQNFFQRKWQVLFECDVKILMLQWCAPSTEVKQDIEEAIEEAKTTKEECNVADSTVHREPTGRVVAIKRRNWRPYCGSLQGGGISSRLPLFVPVGTSLVQVCLLYADICISRWIGVFQKYEYILNESQTCLINVLWFPLMHGKEIPCFHRKALVT